MTIRSQALAAIVAHARETEPAECCGLLIGIRESIHEAVRIRNLADGNSRYLLDPKEHIEGRREARNRGLEVLGFYHSHPRSAPRPSPTDLAEAAYPDHLYLIVGEGAMRGGGAENAGLFKLAADGFVTIPLVVVDDLS